MSFPILLVQDNHSPGALRQALEEQGHVVVDARDEPEAIVQLRRSGPAVVLTDLTLPIGDGFGVLRAARELDPELQVAVMAADGSVQDAVTAMKEGAIDFLAKPVDPDRLALLVERAIAQRRTLAEYIRLKEELAERRGAPRIIGKDVQLRQALQHLHRAAGTDATVLLEGRAARARNCSRAHCTRSVSGPAGPLSPSTVQPFPKGCWKRSCSVTRRAPSPGPS